MPGGLRSTPVNAHWAKPGWAHQFAPPPPRAHNHHRDHSTIDTSHHVPTVTAINTTRHIPTVTAVDMTRHVPTITAVDTTCHVTAITTVETDATRYCQHGGYWGEGQTCREEGRKGAGREMKMQEQGDDNDIVIVPASSQRWRGGGGSIGASSFRPLSCSYSQYQKQGSVKPTAAPF